MIRLAPVEAGALHDQHLLLRQQLVGELLVVGDRVQLRVEAREHVERRLGLDHRHAGDLRQQVVGQVALARETPARCDQVLDALVAAECGLDRELPRRVGAQAHRGQHVEALDVVLGVPLRARHHHPAGTVAAGAIVLRQPVEGDAQHVVGQRRDAGVRLAVVQRLVVDLVGEDDQLVLPRDLHDLLQHLHGIQRARRIVRVDDDDGPRARRHLAADVGDVGQPAGLLVADVVHGRAARQPDDGRVQRIVRRRDQHLVARVEQRVHAEGDQLGRAVAQVDVVHRHVGDLLFLRVVDDGLARREQALRVGVGRGVGQVADHVLHDLVGRLEAERGDVADVQLDDVVPLVLHLAGLVEDRAADVVADVGELAGLDDRLHGRHPCA